MIDLVHSRIIKAAHLFTQALFIYGADLLQQYN